MWRVALVKSKWSVSLSRLQMEERRMLAPAALWLADPCSLLLAAIKACAVTLRVRTQPEQGAQSPDALDAPWAAVTGAHREEKQQKEERKQQQQQINRNYSTSTGPISGALLEFIDRETLERNRTPRSGEFDLMTSSTFDSSEITMQSLIVPAAVWAVQPEDWSLLWFCIYVLI